MFLGEVYLLFARCSDQFLRELGRPVCVGAGRVPAVVAPEGDLVRLLAVRGGVGHGGGRGRGRGRGGGWGGEGVLGLLVGGREEDVDVVG